VNRSPIGTTLKKVSYPTVAIRDTHDTVYIDATVPGLKSEDISIDFDDGYIKVSAEKQGEVDGEFVHREIHRSSFSRWFPVDVKVFDVEQISANIEDGILTIAVPKREEAKKPLPRKIEVK
jgi:HSP20 family protein